MTARVLIVDDDDEILEMLASTLGFHGYTVDRAAAAADALAAMSVARPDVIVLDVMMPHIDGFDLVQLIRGRDAQVPILFLSARDGVDDRVRGLRLGADDYVTKPFSSVEVLARIEVLLRRRGAGTEVTEDEVLRVGDLTLNVERHLVQRGGRTIELSPTEFRLLELLMAHAGRVLSKGQILREIWMYDFGGDANVVERFISSLRRKLDGDDPPMIQTVRGFGYTIRAAPGA